VGAALLGSKKGDAITVDTPRGIPMELTILKIGK
jgi:transcription elongation GreA/GreB family factor